MAVMDSPRLGARELNDVSARPTYMNCDQIREAVSAMIDDEEPDLSAVIVEAHLAGCPACCDWRERAHAFLRASRIGSPGPAPGPAPGWLAVLVSRAPSRFRSAAAWLRAVGVLIAVTMLVLTVPLFTGHPVDTTHDAGAFEAALAVVFLLAAWRPLRAAGVAIVAGPAGVFLVALEAGALARGGGSLLDLSRHLATLAGWLVFTLIVRRTPPDQAWKQTSRMPAALTLLRRRRAFPSRTQTNPAAAVACSDAARGDDEAAA
jgi:predicted anti-sigma-YlaC factor YlaD